MIACQKKQVLTAHGVHTITGSTAMSRKTSLGTMVRSTLNLTLITHDFLNILFFIAAELPGTITLRGGSSLPYAEDMATASSEPPSADPVGRRHTRSGIRILYSLNAQKRGGVSRPPLSLNLLFGVDFIRLFPASCRRERQQRQQC